MKEERYLSDEIISAKLKDYASETPMHLWAAIEGGATGSAATKEPDIPANTPFAWKKWSLLLLLFAFSTAAFGWGITYFNQHNEQHDLAHNHSKHNHSKNSLKGERSQEANYLATALPLGDTSANSNRIDDNIDQDKVVANNTSNTSKELEQTAHTSTTFSNQMENVVEEKQGSTTALFNKKQKKRSNKSVKKQSAHKKQNNQLAASILNANETIHTLTANHSAQSHQTSEVENVEQGIFNLEKRKKASLLNKLVPQSSELSANSLSEARLIKDGPKSGCSNFNTRPRNNFYVDVYGSPDYLNRSFSARNSELVDYVGLRENTEKTLLGFTAGIRVGFESRSGLVLASGLSFSQLSERLEYGADSTFTTRTVNVVDTTITSMMDTTVIEYTYQITEVGVRRVANYNYYRLVDVPLLLGYHAKSGNFNLNVHAGVIMNIFSFHSGRILDTDLALVGIENDQPGGSYFKRSIGLSFYSSIGVACRINPQYDFLVEPNVRYIVHSITESTYPVEQKYLITGINLGLRYKF